VTARKESVVPNDLGGDGRHGSPSQRVSQEAGEGTEQLLSNLEIQLGSLPSDISAEATRTIQDLQQILGEIRGELRGLGRVVE